MPLVILLCSLRCIFLVVKAYRFVRVVYVEGSGFGVDLVVCNNVVYIFVVCFGITSAVG